MAVRKLRRPSAGLGVLLLAVAGTCACGGRPGQQVRVVGTIRPPAGMEADCTMTCADPRGHVLARHAVRGRFEVAVPVGPAPKTYRFNFRCDGFDAVSTALTLGPLPDGTTADLGTIALGPPGGRGR